MKINILAFGQLTDIIRVSDLTITEALTTDELNTILHQKFPALAGINYRMAVNKKIIQQSISLAEQDTVALLPPFSGG